MSKLPHFILVPRNYDPALHPFEAPREYVRALNSIKLERVFAKPFIGNLDGHRDGISCMAKQSHALSIIASGDYCGEVLELVLLFVEIIFLILIKYCIYLQVRVWDIPQRKCKWSIKAHNGFVRGLSFCNDNDRFISLGQDKTIKIWGANEFYITAPDEPLQVLLSRVNNHF